MIPAGSEKGGHFVYGKLPTPSSTDEAESEDCVRIQGKTAGRHVFVTMGMLES